MRKALVIAVLISSVVLLAYCYLSRPKPLPKLLRPIVVTWQEVGKVEGFVDLDADGNDELLVQDRDGQWWWVQFSPTAVARQKIPIPKDANCWPITSRGQMLAFWHPQIRQALLITRQGKKWVMKDLCKLKGNEMMVVLDADHDGQVDDAIMEYGQTRRVFSRMKNGTIVERPNLPDFQADLDGDGKDDAIYSEVRTYGCLVGEMHIHIHLSSGRKASLKLPLSVFIVDLDGDKVAEIVSEERSGMECRFCCWRYEKGGWRKSLSSKFVGEIVMDVSDGDVLWDFPLLVMTTEGQREKIWEIRWWKGKWMKRLMGEVPESNANKIWFARTGQDWIVGGFLSPPEWQEWLWMKVGQHLQRFLPLLHEPKERFFVYGWDGQQRWTLLGRWNEGRFRGFQLADMDGDGKRELSVAFQRRVLVAKFEDGRWQTGWAKVPSLIELAISPSYFRYGGKEWTLFQEVGSHRYIAIALEGRQ